MEKEMIRTLSYFCRFGYPPTLEELHTFLSRKTNRKVLLRNLNGLKKRNIVKFIKSSDKSDVERYMLCVACLSRYGTGGEYLKKVQSSKSPLRRGYEGQVKVQSYLERKKFSEQKTHRIKGFVQALSRFPQIKLVGLSGSVAMLNADEEADIDIFIITAANRLWTGRLISLGIAQLFGLRRVYGQNKAKDLVCPNLFFDEADMAVPKRKKTEYVAHEILQMKPLVNKEGIYERFLWENRWVKKLFPNVDIKSKVKNQKSKVQLKSKKLYIPRFMFNVTCYSMGKVESVAKMLQMMSIKRHRTTETITDRQLWFFPDDFEKTPMLTDIT